VKNKVHMYILSRSQINATEDFSVSWKIFDGSRLISVGLTACFEPRNRDSDTVRFDFISIHKEGAEGVHTSS
jgi:hypothetical protein